jgi:IclR family transcriptional regulator, acetate operon repressor
MNSVINTADAMPRPGVRIQSVVRAGALLMLVASGKTDGTAKQLAQAAGLPAPTAHHLLGTLVAEGLLAKDGKARYLLGVKIAVLAEALQRAMTPPEYLLEPLRRLSSTTGETSYLAAWRQGEIKVQASTEGHEPVRVSLPLTPYTDAHARAAGKLLLAYASEELRDGYLRTRLLRAVTPHTITSAPRLLEEFLQIRRQGYAMDSEEFQLGVSCIAAPVLVEGVIIGAYSISVPTPRFIERRDRLLEATLAVAGSVRIGDTREAFGGAAHPGEFE